MEILDIAIRFFVSFCLFASLVVGTFVVLFRIVLYDRNIDENSLNYVKKATDSDKDQYGTKYNLRG